MLWNKNCFCYVSLRLPCYNFYCNRRMLSHYRHRVSLQRFNLYFTNKILKPKIKMAIITMVLTFSICLDSWERPSGVSARQLIAFSPFTLASLIGSFMSATRFSTACSLIQLYFPSVVIAMASRASAALLLTLPSSSLRSLTRSGTVSKVRASFLPFNGMLKSNDKFFFFLNLKWSQLILLNSNHAGFLVLINFKI